MKKNYFLFLLSATFFFSTALSQNTITDSTAAVLANWPKADVQKFTLKQTKEKYDNGKRLSGGSSLSEIEISVADVSDISYTLHWKYNKITVEGMQHESPLVQQFTKLVEGITFKYLTTETGSFTELLNWKEVQDAVYVIIDKMGKEENAKELKPMLVQVKNVFASKESIEQLIMKDIQMFHSLFGGEYKLKEKITAETQLPNFLGGNPFPAVLVIEMTTLDPVNKTCTITMHQEIDKQKATKEINAWLEKSGKPANVKTALININDESSYEVELKTGWMKRVYYKRIAETGNLKNIEIHEIKKI